MPLRELSRKVGQVSHQSRAAQMVRNFPIRVLALLTMWAIGGAAPALAAGGVGAEIATHGTPGGVPACMSCHGAHGGGDAAAGIPRLAGLSAPYMTAQLFAFASG